jgi:hypothetical protein
MNEVHGSRISPSGDGPHSKKQWADCHGNTHRQTIASTPKAKSLLTEANSASHGNLLT